MFFNLQANLSICEILPDVYEETSFAGWEIPEDIHRIIVRGKGS